MTATSSNRWRIADELSWRCWDDEVVVYDNRSGDTHRLTLSGSALFLKLQQRQELDTESVERDQALADLIDIGVIEPLQ
jgi:hypothetical protein